MSKYSKASKARWAKIPAKERSARMSKIAKKRQSMLSPEQRKKNMTKARRALIKRTKNKNGNSTR